mmetsp:Transcript_13955/g.29938  ORF Transcript_13955/g.29938 Transcript_13955/m.29938 type:complete len:202 (-) Transcript_13955:242-847(-)
MLTNPIRHMHSKCGTPCCGLMRRALGCDRQPGRHCHLRFAKLPLALGRAGKLSSALCLACKASNFSICCCACSAAGLWRPGSCPVAKRCERGSQAASFRASCLFNRSGTKPFCCQMVVHAALVCLQTAAISWHCRRSARASPRALRTACQSSSAAARFPRSGVDSRAARENVIRVRKSSLRCAPVSSAFATAAVTAASNSP